MVCCWQDLLRFVKNREVSDILDFINSQNFCYLWVEILVGGSKTDIRQQSQKFFLGYRMICNSIDSFPSQMSSFDYEDYLLTGLINAIPSSTEESTAGLVESFNYSLHCHLMLLLRDQIELSSHLISICSSTWVLDSTMIIQSRLPLVSNFYQIFFRAALKVCEFPLFVDSVFLRFRVRIEFIQLGLDCCSSLDLVSVVDHVASLWGDRLFVARGNNKLQEHLTNILLFSLQRMKIEDLKGESYRGVSLIVILSSGVSAHLDSTDSSIQRRGMVVGKCFSSMLGATIDFDFSSNDIDKEKKRSTAFESLIDSDGSDSDDIVELDSLTHASTEITCSGDESNRIVYLRHCLESKFQTVLIVDVVVIFLFW